MADQVGRSARRAATLEAALSALEALDVEALRTRWQALTGRAAPATFRAPLLRAAVAYQLQERALGSLRAGTRHLLHRVADAADPARRQGSDAPAAGRGAASIGPSPQISSGPDQAVLSRRTPAPSLRIKPGTRLLRTWQGSTHEVLVGEDGVSYRGETYRSLSEVARLITGQRWSGPLFFGLKRRTVSGGGGRPESDPNLEPRP